MVNDQLHHNATELELELDWFVRILQARLDQYFEKETAIADVFDIEPPDLSSGQSLYASFLRHYRLGLWERLAILLALIPHIRPQLLDVFFLSNKNYDRGFTEFGGITGSSHGGFLPTGETLRFLLSGGKLEDGFTAYTMFDRDHVFAKHDILKLDVPRENEPRMCGQLVLSQEIIDYFTTGEIRKPTLSFDFPAQHISTELDWEDLVLEESTLSQVKEIQMWIDHGQTLLQEWQLAKKLRPGYRCLFYGPPGTGKSMTACLLGKYTNRDVYKIDLSSVVSKYIGETEKNLSRIFDQAEYKNWILFFDEADALFGKRTSVSDSRDRFANQEVSYLLQRIEVFDGVIILASNMKNNLDDAFVRRFESIINFPMPGESQRFRLWQKGFSPKCKLEESINLRDLARTYELSGGATMNIVRYSSLMALNRGSNIILLHDLEEGIKKEFQKEGRIK